MEKTMSEQTTSPLEHAALDIKGLQVQGELTTYFKYAAFCVNSCLKAASVKLEILEAGVATSTSITQLDSGEREGRLESNLRMKFSIGGWSFLGKFNFMADRIDFNVIRTETGRDDEAETNTIYELRVNDKFKTIEPEKFSEATDPIATAIFNAICDEAYSVLKKKQQAAFQQARKNYLERSRNFVLP